MKVMSKQYRMLVITDHKTHGKGESIYPLLKAMSNNRACSSIEVASRGKPENQGFFYDYDSTTITSLRVDDNFEYQEGGEDFLKSDIKAKLEDYDVVFIRLDRPVPDEFLDFITTHIPEHRVINRPEGIRATGSKDFLLNFPELCPPIKLCSSLSDILDFYSQFPVVLKPLRSYGGKGIIRIMDDTVWENETQYPLTEYQSVLENNLKNQGQYLAMKYLKNVGQGDKRVIVVNGKIMGTTLRIPKEGSWICNLSAGGSSNFAEPDQNEIKIADTISPSIVEQGVVIFGFDTLVDDTGNRVLSEINTLNVGGLLQAEMHSGKPVVQDSANLMWDYICKNIT
jgi:glutathione synthase